MTDTELRSRVCRLITDFVEGRDRTPRHAAEIETSLADLCSDELGGDEVEPYASLLEALSLYERGGGAAGDPFAAFFYDEAKIMPVMILVLRKLRGDEPQATYGGVHE